MTTNTPGVAKNAGRSTRRWRTIRGVFKSTCELGGLPCWLCRQPIDYLITDIHDDEVWEPDHLYPVSTHPERAEDINNLRPSHRGCNRSRGNTSKPPVIITLSRNWWGNDK